MSFKSATIVPEQQSTTSSSPGDGTQTRIIVICVVSIVGGVLILAALFFLIWKCQRKRRPGYELIEDYSEPVTTQSIPQAKSDEEEPADDPRMSSRRDRSIRVDPLADLRRPIRIDHLADYVAQKEAEDVIITEFQKLPKHDFASISIGSNKLNARKNRYSDVFPYDHTLVPLEAEPGHVKVTYINASFIKGYKDVKNEYISTQGPKDNTVNDFWRMIWQQNVNLIVMLTMLNDGGKEKCEQYWPEKVDESKTYDKISVQLIREKKCNGHVYREFTIHDERKGNEPPRKIFQMHFIGWKEHSKPQHHLPLLQFRSKVRELQKYSSGPVLVHCSAGVGRTGTYIALDILLEKAKHEGELSFFACVETLRHQRMHMVQTWQQYCFLHEAVLEYLQMGETAIHC